MNHIRTKLRYSHFISKLLGQRENVKKQDQFAAMFENRAIFLAE